MVVAKQTYREEVVGAVAPQFLFIYFFNPSKRTLKVQSLLNFPVGWLTGQAAAVAVLNINLRLLP